MPQADIAKLSPPRLSRVIKRERLFKRISQIYSETPAVWLGAPAGAGKSTLIASYIKKRRLKSIWYQFDEGDTDIATFFHYLALSLDQDMLGNAALPHLTAEYLPQVNVFARRYFEQFFSLLPRPSVLVFENCHVIPKDSPLHQILYTAVSSLPDKVYIAFTSRSEPMHPVANLQLKHHLLSLGSHEMKFNDEEAELLAAQRLHVANRKVIDNINARVNGWAAGLQLMINQLNNVEDLSVAEKIIEETPESVFDYFASEYFYRAAKETQLFLLKTSWLPFLTVDIASKLTKDVNTEEILDRLVNDHYFTERHESQSTLYRYQQLFKEFLQQKALSILGGDELYRIKSETVAMLLDYNYYEEAIELTRELENWEQFEQQLLHIAPTLIEQGRYQTLSKWLNQLPAGRLEDSAWLKYWNGRGTIYKDLINARKCFSDAFFLFRRNEDYGGQLNAWSSIIETFFYERGDAKEIDQWLDAFFETYSPQKGFPTPVIDATVSLGVFTAMVLRCPDHDQMPYWTDKLLSMLHQVLPVSAKLKIANNLMFHLIWYSGNRGKASVVFEAISQEIDEHKKIEPFLLAMWYAHTASYHCWFSGNKKQVYEYIDKALKTADHYGVHFADSLAQIVGACTAFMNGDLDRGHQFIRGSRNALDSRHQIDLALYHQYLAWEYWLDEKLPDANAHCETSLEIMTECGVPNTQIRSYIGLAQISASLDETKSAYRYLAHARRMSRGLRSENNEYLCSIISALFALRKGREWACKAHLEKAFHLAKRQGYVNLVWMKSRDFSELCTFALSHEIEPEYVSYLIKTLKLAPTASTAELSNWPWPVKVYTLGRFEVFRDGKSLNTLSKTHSRPISLLRKLIELGATKVPVDRLVDSLLGDQTSETLHQFHTHLYRLRKILGSEEAVLWETNVVSLNPEYCWLDVWALDQLLQDTKSSGVGILSRLDAVNKLYRGPFLQGLIEESQAIVQQQRILRKYVQFVLDAGSLLQQEGQWQRCVELYWNALEIDGLDESINRELISAYLSQGRHADAQGVYRQYARLLDSELGVRPSSELRQLVYPE